jgi:hypothetical protein
MAILCCFILKHSREVTQMVRIGRFPERLSVLNATSPGKALRA